MPGQVGLVRKLNTSALATAAQGLKADSALQAESDPVASAALVTHAARTDNPHIVTAAQMGLGNVSNTSDANKPVSSAVQTALDLKANLANPTFTGTVSGITSAMVGLSNVNNTSDASKPISTATQTALNLKGTAVAVPFVMALPVILALDDIVRVPVPFTGTITRISFSLQALGSGTITAVLKNDAAQTIATLAATGAGIVETTSPSISAITAGDHLRLGFSGVGVGAIGAVVSVFILPA